jgi:DNA-binding transcriptional LysR family regulator
LSQQIRALEAELGGELIERLPRALRLTPAGEAFLPKARAAVRAADDAAALARQAIAAGPGNVCLAVTPAVAPRLIADALLRSAADRGDRVVRWHEYESQARVEEKVADNGVGTIGLGIRPVEWTGPMVALGRDDFVIAAPPGDELAHAGEEVPLGALADRLWIGIDRDERDPVAAAFAAAGFVPREPYETTRPAAALGLVAAGLGVALVPRSAIFGGPAVAVVELEDSPQQELIAFADRPWSAAALDFLAALIGVMTPTPDAPAAMRRLPPGGR